MDKARINAFLTELLANGRGEVGLEVGADPGLAPSEYIQIPRMMAVGFTSKGRKTTPVSSAATSAPEASTPHNAGGIMVHTGRLWSVDAAGKKALRLSEFKMNPTTDYDTEIRAFVAANTGHIRDTDLKETQIMWVHAVRYWSVKAGFVASTKSREFVDVPNPSADEMKAVADDVVSGIAGYSGQAWTACAARTANWRKSNHATGGATATGGAVATGFASRWLRKEGYWSMEPDKARAAAENRSATTAFYIATHACSVHAVLALLVPNDEHHWAVIDAKYGLIKAWDTRESASQRLTPRTQVAGASMVTDAVVVLTMLINENLSGLLTESARVNDLHAAYTVVKENGMRCATYAGWFFNGHPEDVKPVEFAQKDVRWAALVGELGAVAKKYYNGTTIGDSPSLESAMSQMATTSAQNLWAAIARAKATNISQAAVAVYGRISGASVSVAITQLGDKDRSVVETALTAYNAETERVAKLFEVSAKNLPTIEQVMKNASAADARAEELAGLGAV